MTAKDLGLFGGGAYVCDQICGQLLERVKLSQPKVQRVRAQSNVTDFN
jgi:hypothetical protein